jgi:hypothetical protein
MSKRCIKAVLVVAGVLFLYFLYAFLTADEKLPEPYSAPSEYLVAAMGAFAILFYFIGRSLDDRPIEKKKFEDAAQWTGALVVLAAALGQVRKVPLFAALCDTIIFAGIVYYFVQQENADVEGRGRKVWNAFKTFLLLLAIGVMGNLLGVAIIAGLRVVIVRLR